MHNIGRANFGLRGQPYWQQFGVSAELYDTEGTMNCSISPIILYRWPCCRSAMPLTASSRIRGIGNGLIWITLFSTTLSTESPKGKNTEFGR